jgi:hypothetical protein
MTISALVLTLDPARADTALAQLASDTRLTLGKPEGCQVPVVAETSSSRDGRALVASLQEVPGVDLVHLVMVDFSEEEL